MVATVIVGQDLEGGGGGGGEIVTVATTVEAIAVVGFVVLVVVVIVVVGFAVLAVAVVIGAAVAGVCYLGFGSAPWQLRALAWLGRRLLTLDLGIELSSLESSLE